ncbi:hypothetical protein LTR49_024253, partial [Elasticomyces elasticus]
MAVESTQRGEQVEQILAEGKAVVEAAREKRDIEEFVTGMRSAGWVSKAGMEVDLPNRETEVDPMGDTLLAPGQGDKLVELRVQSQILWAASASPAEKSRFRSWLRLKFGELHNIELTDEGEAVPAMKVICEATHFCTSTIPEVLNPRELVAIGTVSKKDESMNALWPWSATYLRQGLRTASIPDLKEPLTDQTVERSSRPRQ